MPHCWKSHLFMLHALLIVLTDQGTNMGCASSTTNTSTQDSDSGANLTNSDSRTRPNQQFGQNTRIKNSTKETISYEEVGETTHSNETHSKARQEITTQYKTNAYATGNEPKLPKSSKKEITRNVDFTKTDEHARKAPKELCKSLPDLINYFRTNSWDTLFLVRSFFVWISRNIRYDVEGYFKGKYAASDYKSVMLHGTSVCEGYANVMLEMCREAGIEARKLSGFAKGYGYSPENPFTTNSSTDHAWNAVKINGKWYLIDSTWGAGHLNDNNEYEAVFTEFYFLPEPEMFILSHYPYENCSIEDSEKWQLLNRPVSLEEFNRSLMIYPTAHELGIYPTSHKENIVSFTDEVEFTFKEDAVRTNKLIATLYKRQGNMLYEEKFACHTYFSEGELKLKVKPSTTGTYRLQVFGNKRYIDGKASLLFEYILECTVPLNGKGRREYPYPETYSQTLEDECEISEPLGKPIMQNTPVTMRFKSTVLKRMMVNDLEMLRKENNIFESTFTAPGSDYAIQVFGARQYENPGSYHGVYTFRVL